ncbi:FecCD family ABC transporter permease [Algicella marina]|uniref:Iron chelate uptake ABC transporter family permease subunit n=1 Tax=Algicella marina TaxID=2683284 RepID=A0A6P1T1H9_9RHOB|nr:iron ABC transporter permease [Algicella marina]QHQ35139.1 iron chelate uptake ABC transporter family permease subunit [Algicella marina]
MRAALLLPLLLLVATVTALMSGQASIGLPLLWEGLVTGEGPGALMLDTIRGPRVATAIGAGGVLGLSGFIFQTLFRNPLASPDILGFTPGAGLAIVAAITFHLNVPMPLVSAAGGIAAALLVALLAIRRGHETPPLTLILVGLGVGFFSSAFSTFVMTVLPHSEAAEAQRWLTGSLAARDWGHVAQVWWPGLLLVLLAIAQARNLAGLELGNDLASGLGLRTETVLWLLAVTGVLLAATGVAVAGPVPFVALMAGPLGIRITGARTHTSRMLAAAGTGALVLTLADLAARTALPGIVLPAGVMTGILGAPYLLWRLSREMEKGTL